MYSINCQDAWNSKYTFESETGKQFVIDSLYLEDIAVVRQNIRQEVTSRNVREFVFLSGADTTHYRELRVSIHSIQKYYPRTKIIFYDLGLEISEQFEVSHNIFVCLLVKDSKKTHTAYCTI